ncbi:MAG: HIT family hydrolase [Candidatus Aenigmatarchaeota archaeon]|nr:MAG: HIT family hydrolase [Candidatus Aenigmarchaeota archaeon]RLJ07023.1 MAG: HIT family hydrolase [Candidatus Aenigmarchaeota archaeon]RLJ08219.1 MAG: HIT family hydrolase [Candidatus Aenigmarchaeota archaeon]
MYKFYLWATSRMKYVKRKHKKSRGCIFCNIAKDDPDTPKKVLFKDKRMMVIMNIFPYNVGHLEVVPVKHVEDINELSEKDYQYMWELVRKSIKLLKKALGAKAFNVGLNLGGDLSGGSILHLHVQIVPRYVRDAGFMEVTANTKVMPQSLDETYKILMKHVNILKNNK